MKLVEKHIIKPSHSFYKECDGLCFRSKNLYNSLLYISRQFYKENKKYIGFNKLYNQGKKLPIWNDCELHKKVCSQVVFSVHENYKSYFEAVKSYNKDKLGFNGFPKTPKYKDSEKGRFFVKYTYQDVSKMVFKRKGEIKLAGTNISIKTKIKNFLDICEVRIVPQNKHYIIEVVYKKQEKEAVNSENFAAIDLGVNNLVTVSFNDCKNPLIINGRPLKSINQFYNKKKAEYQSKLNTDQYNSNKIIKLTNKRNNKINDYLHKSSKYLIDQFVSKNVSKVIIGYNPSWKQNIKLGKKTNQSFVSIPFYKFIQMIEYKCKLEGIEFIKTEEAYTSKCSFLDNEEMCYHESYQGKRIKRGLFQSKNETLINADLNGSYNILRKVVPHFKGIEGVAVHPKRISFKR